MNRPNSPLLYFFMHSVGRFVWFCTMDARVLGREHLNYPGGYLLASNHFSHIDPLLIGTLHPRAVDWMTRIEFFRSRPLAWLIRNLGGFRVKRQGVPVSAIRTAMARVQAGRIVGMFPEGGVTGELESVCRRGRIKQGVCTIACRTGKPIVPCVVLGSPALRRIAPWLPVRRAQIRIALGAPIHPPLDVTNRKLARRAMAEQLQDRLVELYEQLLADAVEGPDFSNNG